LRWWVGSFESLWSLQQRKKHQERRISQFSNWDEPQESAESLSHFPVSLDLEQSCIRYYGALLQRWDWEWLGIAHACIDSKGLQCQQNHKTPSSSFFQEKLLLPAFGMLFFTAECSISHPAND
jgi:hypothetical protein